MRGQISAEMLILLAVVLAIVALAAAYLMDVGKKAGGEVEERTTEILEGSSGGAGAPGDECSAGEDCISGKCEFGICK